MTNVYPPPWLFSWYNFQFQHSSIWWLMLYNSNRKWRETGRKWARKNYFFSDQQICITTYNEDRYFINSSSVFRIRIWIRRIRMFLGLLEEKPWFLLFCDLFMPFILKKLCKCAFKKNKHKNLRERKKFLLASWRSLTERAGSVSQRYGSEIFIRIRTKMSWIRNTAPHIPHLQLFYEKRYSTVMDAGFLIEQI